MEQTESKIITATITNITFQNPVTNWCVVQTEAVRKDGTVAPLTMKGVMPGVAKGKKYEFTGTIEKNKYGTALNVSSLIERRPSDKEGIYKYLASGLIKKIGPVLARSIVDTFGDDTLDVLDNEPERLMEVPNIGKKRVQNIIEAVKSQRAIRAIMVWLKRYDITNGLATKIYKTWGDNSVARLEENPYRLADDIKGVGFKKADDVALKLGLPEDSEFRIASAVKAVLEDAANEGHTYMMEDNIVSLLMTDKYIDLQNEDKIRETLHNNVYTDVEITEDGEVALPKYYYAEKTIAERITTIRKKGLRNPNAEPNPEKLRQLTGLTYSDEQTEAIRKALRQSVTILTGGPGTGKTATTNAIIRTFEDMGYHLQLAAPTGRAAKRVTEVSGRTCKTIHRLLEFSQDGFQRNQDNPLTGDVLIVDESSMIDTVLMKNLLNAVPNRMKVIFVGDPDQLPSVGAGNVLNELITYFGDEVAALTKVYRQAEGSQIVMAAHDVNNGRTPILRAPNESKEFGFIAREEATEVAEEIVKKAVYCQKQNIEFQILSPMKRDWDPVGTIKLNKDLQNALNPEGKALVKLPTKEYRIGDRVMQMKNNYDKGVFNGDIGKVALPVPIDEDDENYDPDNKPVMSIDYGEDIGKINYFTSDINEVDLAYATTVHKSQGSEYPIVIMPAHISQYIMLKRNLLYTAITRAKKYFLLIGQAKAVRTAASRIDSAKRNTLLLKLLNEQNVPTQKKELNSKQKGAKNAYEQYKTATDKEQKQKKSK